MAPLITMLGGIVVAAGLIVGFVAFLRWRDRRSQSRSGKRV
ncbi:MAG: hypothetical protein NUW06_04645 [Candidatus Acetothermia bacterium]|jgi:hypothetical protein|nr:hypothetical protein [Candidatus Acetothermia bacterium]MDH7505252.1 hypothetical protein [Candidatus Acetothermia bacterium]